MIAILINAAAIAAGSLIGLCIKSRIRKTVTDAILTGIGFFTVYLGIAGIAGAEGKADQLVYLLSVTLGGAIGTVLKIDERIDALALKAQHSLSDGEENRFASGLTGFFLMSFVGAYTLVACFNAGLGDNAMLYTKAVMDLIVSMAMAASLGIGVLFAGVPIVLCEAVLVCFSGYLSSVWSEAMIEAFSCTGAILTLAIGANVAGVTRFKVVNYVPALLFAPLLAYLFALL